MDKPIINKWVATPHAIQRMSERGISTAEIDDAIKNADRWLAQGPKWIAIKQFAYRKDNMIAAVLLERKEYGLWVVLTVMVNFHVKR